MEEKRNIKGNFYNNFTSVTEKTEENNIREKSRKC